MGGLHRFSPTLILRVALCALELETPGLKELYAEAQASSKARALAAAPAEVSYFALDALFERPVQVELVELLLLPKEHGRFTSCVLVHGMGGTGKVSGLARSHSIDVP